MSDTKPNYEPHVSNIKGKACFLLSQYVDILYLQLRRLVGWFVMFGPKPQYKGISPNKSENQPIDA